MAKMIKVIVWSKVVTEFELCVLSLTTLCNFDFHLTAVLQRLQQTFKL